MELNIDIFDAKSIDTALQKLKSYEQTFKQRVDLFTQRLATELQEEARRGFSSSVISDGSTIDENGKVTIQYRAPNVAVSVRNESNTTLIVIASGEDAVWVEFGTGIYFNGASGSSPHPKGAELGMTIGDYGNGHGKRKTWGYYEEGSIQLTHGTPAQLPLYLATQSVCNRVADIAREVFGND